MLSPKRTKYRKCQKGRVGRIAQRGHQVAFGTFGLKVVEGGWLTARQIEAGRVVINRGMKRQGSMWIRVFPDKQITAKPAEVRMGKGKGAPAFWVAPVKAGRVIYELDGVSEEVAKKIIRLTLAKFHLRGKMVYREDYKPVV